MKTEHTQGPWQYVGNRVEKHGNEGFYSRICICTDATLCDEHGGTSSANARLIAAAPDLLAALVGMMNKYGDRCAFPTCDASISARAAISKAESNA